MTTVARRILATPARSEDEAWLIIVNLLAPDPKSNAYAELQSITGISSSLIASEAMKDAAIVVSGKGARIRIYCLYDEDAIVGEDANEQPFSTTPTDAEWRISLPCPVEDLEWVQKSLGRRSARITARDLRTEPFEESSEEKIVTGSARDVIVDKESFLKS